MRLLDDMEAYALKLQSRASGYRIGGETALALTARKAALAIATAIEAISNHEANEGERTSAEKEA